MQNSFAGFLGLGFPMDAGGDIHILIHYAPTARQADGEGWQATMLRAIARSQGWMLPCPKSQMLWQGAGNLCTS